MIDWFYPPKIVVCRPALPKDTAEVQELTRWIWDGHDYVPDAWADWLADPEGRLVVAEWGGQVVGLFKLTLLGPGEGWLEGLRVHPELQGRGFASHLFAYLVEAWDELDGGTLRLATVSFRHSVQHMSERKGFAKVGEFTPYQAETMTQDAAASALGISLPKKPVSIENAIPRGTLPSLPGAFQPLAAREIAAARELSIHNQVLGLSWGYMDLGWTWARPSEGRLREACERGQAWWWGMKEGVLAAREDTGEEGENVLSLQLLACPPERLVDCLLDFRRLGGALGFAQVAWVAPLRSEARGALTAAGFRRIWDFSVYLYEKPASAQPAEFS